MQTVPVGIVGASGYSGLELSRILALHPHVELKLLGSDKWAGETAARRAGLPGAAGKLKYAPQERCGELGRECAAVFLATPAEASLELAPLLLGSGVRVVDLSGAFRLRDPALYPKFYGFEHPLPDLLREAFHGIPELAPPPPGTRLVANPACYGRLAPGRKAAELRAALVHKYAEAPFVEVLESPDQVTLKAVTGTNRCQVAVAADRDVVVAISAIDNLVKGAAGQAVQNLNLIMGWPQTAGLDALRGFHP